MKVVVRLRKGRSLNPFAKSTYESMRINVLEITHPDGKTFAEFNNDLFSLIDDPLFIIGDYDVIPTSKLLEMVVYMELHDKCVMCSGVLIPNNKLVKRITSLCFEPTFTFGCTVVRSSWIKSVKIPSYLECSEDSWLYEKALEQKRDVKLFTEFKFEHLNDDWSNKLLASLKWTTANHRLYWEKEKKIGVLCPYPFNYKNVQAYANNIYEKAKIIDDVYAFEIKKAILHGFTCYSEFLSKYNREG